MRQKSRIALRDSRLTAIFLLSTAFALASIGQAQADSYADGSKLFQAKKYASAAKCFDASIKQNPGNDNAYYYHALALHYAKDMKGAIAEYGRIVSQFPSSQAADHSRRALMVLDPVLLRKLSPELFTAAPPAAARSAGSNIISGSRYGSSGSSSPDDHYPPEAKLNFTKEVGLMFVEAQFNNRPMKVTFDTGSQGTTLGKNHLQSLGLPEPTGPRNSLGYWDMRLNIKLGGIERNNFPCAIKESMLDSPSIGQSFFKDFVYTVDNNAQTIRLVKKAAGSSSGVASSSGSGSSSGSSRSSADANAVPFSRDDNYDLMIVSVTVDGRPGRMYVDTGATSVCMSAAQARNFGLNVPEDATDTVINGTTGRMTGKKFSIRTLKLGPVEKRNVDVVVVDNYPIPLPLLGQSFLGDANYSVDDQAKVIRFNRR